MFASVVSKDAGGHDQACRSTPERQLNGRTLLDMRTTWGAAQGTVARDIFSADRRSTCGESCRDPKRQYQDYSCRNPGTQHACHDRLPITAQENCTLGHECERHNGTEAAADEHANCLVG